MNFDSDTDQNVAAQKNPFEFKTALIKNEKAKENTSFVFAATSKNKSNK